MPRRIFRLTLAVALVASCTLVLPAADVVILKDGFVIQGHVSKESETVTDKGSGQSFSIVKGNGFDMIDEGPKIMVFSTNAKQLGVISPDIKLRPEYKAYKMKFVGRRSAHNLPNLAYTSKVSEYKTNWTRTIEVKLPGTFDTIDQQITYIDPFQIYIVSPTHLWRQTHRTVEWDPKLVRKLLLMHPELSEPDGKCDPLKRIALAKFMLDAGWLQLAKDEMDRLKRELVGEMSKDAKTAHEKITKEIDVATAELVVREAELALAAGRYKYAADVLGVFPEKSAEPKQVSRAAKVGADLKTSQERYDTGRRLLRALIDDVTGVRAVTPLLAVGGGQAFATWKPAKDTPQQSLDLAEAAQHVFTELHPDSAIRIETFVALATQAEKERAQFRSPTKTPNDLLATAISGWAMGKGGTTATPEAALKLWRARQLVLAYQGSNDPNARNDILGRYKKTVALGTDELAQIISLLPPAEPEDLINRTGKPIALGKNTASGIFRRTTGPVTGHASGIDYLVKLPPEYHHGRAYPILIVLTHAGINAEDILNPLINESEKNGYIVIAPEWNGQFGKGGWQWRGEDHVYVTAALRDAVRHFTVDNDRVFLMGVADGANMAMDIGMSHPDLFAGVVPVAPIPKWQNMFIHYWSNAQKLPFYVVTGELAGSSVPNLRLIYEKWMPRGYPGLMAVYKGRGLEWYAAETPVIFDWMSRKKRVNGAAVLALGSGRQPWRTMRETDNRFYWLQADKLAAGNQIDNIRPGSLVNPASIQGDIRGNNQIVVESQGVKHITIWLGADMIDWTKPVRLLVNGSVPNGFRPKVIEPKLEVLLEDYYERGDRRMLFLNKMEFDTLP